MRLADLEQIWEATKSPGSNLCTTCFTSDYFELDSYKKMRVFLATGFASNSMMNMINDYCGEDVDKLKNCKGLIELVLPDVNRLVDS